MPILDCVRKSLTVYQLTIKPPQNGKRSTHLSFFQLLNS